MSKQQTNNELQPSIDAATAERALYDALRRSKSKEKVAERLRVLRTSVARMHAVVVLDKKHDTK